MDCSTILLCSAFVWACLHILTFAISARKLPPGPFPLPIVGNLFELGKKPHESLAKLAKTYGSLMTIKLGSLTTIVVSSPAMAQEVLQKHDQIFSGRTIPDAVRIHNHHEVSITWLPPSSHQWRNLRKLCASQIFNPQTLNSSGGIRLKKVKDLIDYIRDNSKSGQAINISQTVFSTILNVISNILFSTDLATFKTGFEEEFKNITRGVLEEAGRPNFVDYFPFLRPFDLQGARRRMATHFEKLDKLFDTFINQRLETKEKDASKDLLDVLLQHTEEGDFKLSRLDINSLLKDLIIAGTDTSAGTIEWAMTELLRNRDVMVKARLELKENIEKDKPIEESDIARLPYLQAIVKETLRLHPPAPLLVPHKAEKAVEICGFVVPRDTQVLVNAWAIGRDPELWVNPTSFMPARFLKSKVDFRGRDFEYIPFGSGRRICPGLSLAYRMVHLILASLLHSFDWEFENGMKSEDIDMEERFGLTLQKAEQLCAFPIQA